MVLVILLNNLRMCQPGLFIILFQAALLQVQVLQTYSFCSLLFFM